jgi:acetyl-CoA carboxylase carboxyltransferase component
MAPAGRVFITGPDVVKRVTGEANCPHEAIIAGPDVLAEWQRYISVNAEFQRT